MACDDGKSKYFPTRSMLLRPILILYLRAGMKDFYAVTTVSNEADPTTKLQNISSSVLPLMHSANIKQFGGHHMKMTGEQKWFTVY